MTVSTGRRPATSSTLQLCLPCAFGVTALHQDEPGLVVDVFLGPQRRLGGSVRRSARLARTAPGQIEGELR
jgi:hypothetical protein